MIVDDNGSFRLIYKITDNFMFTVRCANGQDGWLWYHQDDDESAIKYSDIVAIKLVNNKRFWGIGFYLLIFNLSFAVKRIEKPC